MDAIKHRCESLRSKLGPKIVQVTTAASSNEGLDLPPEVRRQKAELELELQRKCMTAKGDVALLGMTLKGAVALWKDWDGLVDNVTFLKEDKLIFTQGDTAKQMRERQNRRWAEHRCIRGNELLTANMHLDKALKSFKNAIKLDPGNDNAHVGAGMVYTKVKKVPDAIHHFELALKLNAENKTAQVELDKLKSMKWKATSTASSLKSHRKRERRDGGESSKRHKRK